MKKNLLLLSCLVGATFAHAQTTLNIKVNSALDDHEERITGALPQSGTTGNMIAGSTGLELGNESPTTDPQMVGLRFTNVTIPKYATVTNAYIQFTVKGTSKNTDPSNLLLYSQNSENAATFSDNPFELTTRTLNAGSVSWNVSGSSWTTVGSAGTDQRTSDIKSLIQPLVFKANWAPGNAMAFFIKGSGTKEVMAYEGDPAQAAELVVTYSVAGSGTVTTGISELSANAQAVVYPNPFKNQFSVDLEVYSPSELSISVFDLTGKMIEQQVVENPEVGTFHFTSSVKMTPGMYFVKITANNKQQVVKLIAE